MSRTACRLLLTVAVLLAPTIALAHPGHGGGDSLLAGFIHPFGGIDHLLAMTAVGLFAAHLGGRALWAVPATFVAVMALGGVFGAAGRVGAFYRDRHRIVGCGIRNCDFVRHDAAGSRRHGAGWNLCGLPRLRARRPKCRSTPPGPLYGIGFMAATALLHGFGITLGLAVRRFDEAPRRRAMQDLRRRDWAYRGRAHRQSGVTGHAEA